MKTYRVSWEIDIEADSPEDAAQQALDIQRDSESDATFFKVSTHEWHTYTVDFTDREVNKLIFTLEYPYGRKEFLRKLQQTGK